MSEMQTYLGKDNNIDKMTSIWIHQKKIFQ